MKLTKDNNDTHSSPFPSDVCTPKLNICFELLFGPYIFNSSVRYKSHGFTQRWMDG